MDYVVIGSGVCSYVFIEHLLKQSKQLKVLVVARESFTKSAYAQTILDQVSLESKPCSERSMKELGGILGEIVGDPKLLKRATKLLNETSEAIIESTPKELHISQKEFIAEKLKDFLELPITVQGAKLILSDSIIELNSFEKLRQQYDSRLTINTTSIRKIISELADPNTGKHFATKLETEDGSEIQLNNAKVILAKEAPTLLSNSFPNLKIQEKIFLHSSFTARVPLSKFKLNQDLNPLEYGALHVKGKDPETHLNFHVHATIHDRSRKAASEVNYIPSTIIDKQLYEYSNECCIFIINVFGETSKELKPKLNSQDKENLLTETDSKLWDTMDSAAFTFLEKVLAPVESVEYWVDNKFQTIRPSPELIRTTPMVRTSDTIPVGSDSANSLVGKDFQLHGTSNVYVLGEELLPFAIYSPLLTSFGLAQRLADNFTEPMLQQTMVKVTDVPNDIKELIFSEFKGYYEKELRQTDFSKSKFDYLEKEFKNAFNDPENRVVIVSTLFFKALKGFVLIMQPENKAALTRFFLPLGETKNENNFISKYLFSILTKFSEENNISLYGYLNKTHSLISFFKKHGCLVTESPDLFPDNLEKIYPSLSKELREQFVCCWFANPMNSALEDLSISDVIDDDEKFLVEVVAQTADVIQRLEIWVKLSYTIQKLLDKVQKAYPELGSEHELIYEKEFLKHDITIGGCKIGKGATLLLKKKQAEIEIEIRSNHIIPKNPFTVRVNSTDLISYLKKLIKAEQDLSVSSLQIDGQLMEDSKRIGDYSINSPIYLEPCFTPRYITIEESAVRIAYGTNRTPSSSVIERFGGTCDNKLHFGFCDVSVPKIRTLGTLGCSKFWVVCKMASKDDLMCICEHEQHDDKMKYSKVVKSYLKKNKADDFLLFVHGYRVSFNSAIIRTCQLAVDLDFPGVVGCYSWPSKATLMGYCADEEAVDRSLDYFIEYLELIASMLPVRGKINIISHSMGNRLTTKALAERLNQPSHKSLAERLNNLIFAAPDVEQGDFHRRIMEFTKVSPSPITVYCTSYDKALKASARVHESKRFGQYPLPIQAPTVKVIDVDNQLNLRYGITTIFMLNHGYIYETQKVLEHVKATLKPQVSEELELFNDQADEQTFSKNE